MAFSDLNGCLSGSIPVVSTMGTPNSAGVMPELATKRHKDGGVANRLTYVRVVVRLRSSLVEERPVVG